MNAPVLAITLDRLLRQTAEREPRRPMIAISGAPMLDATELVALVAAAAARLQQFGVGPGDRVALWGQNSAAWVVWFLACAWRGAAAVALHPGLTAEELGSALSQARPKWLVMDEFARGVSLRGVLEAASRRAADAAPEHGPPSGHAASMTLGTLRGVTVMPGGDGTPDLEAVIDRSASAPLSEADLEAVLAMLFTSGSSGRPKLVCLSQRALIVNASATARAARIGPADVIASPLPLHHSAGLSSGCVLSLVAGAMWCSSPRFQAATTLAQIQDHGCTVLQGVPTMFKALIEGAGRSPQGRGSTASVATPTLRLGFVGGAPCPPDLLQQARASLGIERLCVVYGQTEFGPTISIAHQSGEETPAVNGVGSPIEGVDVRIVDAASGDACAPGVAGEIQVRGPSCMSGYFHDEAANAAAFAADGWLRTGDFGRVAGGQLSIDGRLKQIIIRGGENVSPSEVEAVLRDARPVADACVVAVPSKHWGEAICAVVAPAMPIATSFDVDALRRLCEERLARYKRPDHYVVVESLPLLASGKVDRRAVQASLADREWT